LVLFLLLVARVMLLLFLQILMRLDLLLAGATGR
jgi:hypothetical protein